MKLVVIIISLCFLSSQNRDIYTGSTSICLASHLAYLIDELELNGEGFTYKRLFQDYMYEVSSGITYKGKWRKQADSIFLFNICEDAKNKEISIDLLKRFNIPRVEAESLYTFGTSKIELKPEEIIKFIISNDSLLNTRSGVNIDLKLRVHR